MSMQETTTLDDHEYRACCAVRAISKWMESRWSTLSERDRAVVKKVAVQKIGEILMQEIERLEREDSENIRK